MKLRTQLQWGDIPENFNREDFKKKLADMCQTIAGMLAGDLNEIQYDFFPKVLDALITHSAFNEWPNDVRIRTIHHLEAMRFIVECFRPVFTDDINGTINGVEKFINSLVVPAQPVNQ